MRFPFAFLEHGHGNVVPSSVCDYNSFMKSTLKKNCTILSFSLLLTLILAVPFFFSPLRFGADTTYHINRIYELAEAIRNHDFYPAILFAQNYHYGYGSPLFYSVFFLYLPALLVLLGVPSVIAYKLLIVLCTFCTVYFLQKLLSRFTDNKAALLFGGALAIYNNYYLSDVFYRGALGEIMAFAVMPFLLDCTYQIFYEEKQESWLSLIFGFAALFLSHNLSFLIFVFVFALLLLFHIKKWTAIKIGKLALSAVLTLCLLAFYLVPMYRQLTLGIYRVSHYVNSAMGGETLQSLTSFSMEYVYVSSTCGLLLLLCPLLYFFVKHDRFTTACQIIGYICLFLCTNLFPWDKFGFLSILQWPGRLMIPVIPLFAFTSGIAVSRLPQKKVSYVLLALTALYALYLGNGIFKYHGESHNTDSHEQLIDYKYYYPNSTNIYWYNPNELSTPDYLLEDAAINYEMNARSVYRINDGYVANINNSYYNYLSFTPTEEGVYSIPYSYYLGYQIQVFTDGVYEKTVLPSANTETGLLNVEVSDVKENQEYVVVYRRAKIEKISFLLSGGTLLLLAAGTILMKKRNR